MNRIDFINQLESLLQNISPAERVEAIQYYNDYFNDAGVENEQDVIEALGNPAKVAENIKRDLSGTYTEGTFQRAASSDRAVVEYGKETGGQEGSGDYGSAYGRSYQNNYQEGFRKSYENTGYSGSSETTYSPEKKLSTGMLILIITVCVLASPIGIGLVGGVFSLAAGLAVAWFTAIVGFGAGALALFACTLGLGFAGICMLFVSPAVGIGLIGGGLFCAGLGLLFLMLTIAMAGIATPAIFRGIISFCRVIFRKRR